MEDLVKKSILGDKNAYTQLMNMLKSDLYRVANARLDNIEDINDAINETILKSYRSLKKLKNIQYFKTWITKILINECNNIYRINKKHLEIIEKVTEIEEKQFFDSYENNISKLEDKLNFEMIINSLNCDEKTIIILYYNNRHTVSEIVDILNMNVNTVKSKLFRAKEKIKQKMEGVNYDGTRR